MGVTHIASAGQASNKVAIEQDTKNVANYQATNSGLSEAMIGG